MAKTTAKGVPGQPTGLRTRVVKGAGTDANPRNVELYWDAPANVDAAPITGYQIEESTDGVNWSLAAETVDGSGMPQLTVSNTEAPEVSNARTTTSAPVFRPTTLSP